MANRDNIDKLRLAAERALPKLPRELREKISALLTPNALATLTIIAAVGIGSHWIGAGEVVDVVLIGWGVWTLGPEVWNVGRDLHQFVTLATHAQTDRDIDRAADHFARAIAVIGVDGLAAILLHKAFKTVREMKGGSPGTRRTGGGGFADKEVTSTSKASSEIPEKPARGGNGGQLTPAEELKFRRLSAIYEALGEQPRRVSLRVEESQHPAAHTVERHGSDIPLDMPRDGSGNPLPPPTGIKSIEGRLFGDTGWPDEQNVSLRWQNDTIMTRTVNNYIQANWGKIHGDLAFDGIHTNAFDSGTAVGEGYVDLNMGVPNAPPNPRYVTTSLVRISIRLDPGPPPDFYVGTAFPDALGPNR